LSPETAGYLRLRPSKADSQAKNTSLLERGRNVYIGLGTVLVIVLIVLLIYLLA